MNKRTLFVGNDINNINNNNSWKNLLKKIVQFCEVENSVRNLRTKPFPLLYEEIFLKSNKTSEMELKKYISYEISKIEGNEIHRQLLTLGAANIITTNYDYSLQKSMGNTIIESKNLGIIKETRYSIFRHHKLGENYIWHIHGECNSPKTITLGFEQYGGTLQQIRNYVATGTTYASNKISKVPLIKRLKTGDVRFDSWIDLLFLHDIHIFGLALDFVENDLWWLITYRARTQKGQSSKITNSISYYMPEKYRNLSIEKIELLKANGINVVFLQGKNKLDYYNLVIDRINGS